MNELTVRIQGGERVTVRSMTTGDADAVLAAYVRLSPASLRYRFLSPVLRLVSTVADDLTTVRDDRVVLLAFDAHGRVVGDGRAIRRAADPSTAELAVTVSEDHRRLGLGTALMRLVTAEARSAGIDHLAGHVLLDNAAAQRMLVAARAESWLDEPGVLGFEIHLRRRTVSPATAARRALGRAS